MSIMSEMEKEELCTRIKAMTKEEQELAVSAIPSYILFSELLKRDLKKEKMLHDIHSILER